MHAFLRDFGFLLATAAILSVYAAISALLAPWLAAPLSVTRFVMPIALCMWATFDARRRRATPSFDFGFLLYLVWYLALPWYLLHTRGRRGWLAILLFFALLMAPMVAYIVAAVGSLVLWTVAGAI